MSRRVKALGIVVTVLTLAVLALALVVSHDSACEAPAAPPKGTLLMRAFTYRCYGAPAVLTLADVVKPAPGPNELLVKVRAASVNPLDWHFMRGKPYVMRLSSGVGKPEDPRAGVDFAGTVEAVGTAVTRFKPGDHVFGGRNGAFAEYLTIREDGAVVSKPDSVTFEQAAAVGIAGVTALQAIRDKGQVKSGQRVLVNGASGGVGTFAVQIAKSSGAEVTGVSSTRNLDLVKSLGADHVIDYTREDFTKDTQRYDVIIDNVGNHPLLEYRQVLTPEGIVVIVGGPSENRWIGPLSRLMSAVVLSPFVSQKFVMFIAQLNQPDLTVLRDLMEAGKLTSVIDRRYPLLELPAAIGYLEEGRARGKVIIIVE